MAVSDLTEEEINILITWISENNHNDSNKVGHVRVKSSLRQIYVLFIFLNSLVTIIGTGTNIVMLGYIIRKRLYKNSTFLFLANIAFSDILKALIVLPLTVAHLMLDGWIFGRFMCYFLPMMHSFPIHATMISYVLIGVDRYRLVMHPMKRRLPAGPCLIFTWVLAVCVIIPYSVYIKYIDISTVLETPDQFQGVGLCVVNMERHIEEYIRAMFVTLYCLPLAVVAFLYVKVSAEIKTLTSSGNPTRMALKIEPIHHLASVSNVSSSNSRVTFTTSLTEMERVNLQKKPKVADDNKLSPASALEVSSTLVDDTSKADDSYRHERKNSSESDCNEDIDLHKERMTQRYVMLMVIMFAICWCPINLLNVIYNFVYENQDNRGHFDITYVTFIFFGFLSTCVNPVLFALWQTPPQKKRYLKKYFRLCGQSSTQQSLHKTRNNQEKDVMEAQSHSYTQSEEIYFPCRKSEELAYSTQKSYV